MKVIHIKEVAFDKLAENMSIVLDMLEATDSEDVVELCTNHKEKLKRSFEFLSMVAVTKFN